MCQTTNEEVLSSFTTIVNTKPGNMKVTTTTTRSSSSKEEESGMDVGIVDSSTLMPNDDDDVDEGKHQDQQQRRHASHRRSYSMLMLLIMVTFAVTALQLGRRQQVQGQFRGKGSKFDSTFPSSTTSQDIYIYDPKLSRTRWPELVGYSGDVAKASLQEKYGDMYNIYIVQYGSATTMDYRTNRIRIYVDENDIVTQMPTTG